MRKHFLRLGSLMGMLAVVLGAFASHSLKNMLTPEEIATFEIGVRYQFYHAFAILIVSIFLYIRETKFATIAGWLFFIGIILFSGSLYLLAFKNIAYQFPTGVVAPITPIGGVLFIAGWIFLFLSSYQTPEKNHRSKS
ncbi:MAG: DUF423 domain-containing protein [Saprospiraceae bacterium]|nr:DUF423 domain-containing protein [Saprospiraceae bacterium]